MYSIENFKPANKRTNHCFRLLRIFGGPATVVVAEVVLFCSKMVWCGMCFFALCARALVPFLYVAVTREQIVIFFDDFYVYPMQCITHKRCATVYFRLSRGREHFFIYLHKNICSQSKTKRKHKMLFTHKSKRKKQ